jgi:tRNA A37 threonylcarbamoyltransferase TsaD
VANISLFLTQSTSNPIPEQDSVIEYTCKHLEPALAFRALKVPEFVADPCKSRKLVVAGGVAANEQFFGRISEVASAHKFTVSVPPKHLCTDNGVMVG